MYLNLGGLGILSGDLQHRLRGFLPFDAARQDTIAVLIALAVAIVASAIGVTLKSNRLSDRSSQLQILH